MGTSLSPAKVVLLAVDLASRAEIEILRHLTGRYDSILGSELVLRILLTYLPETTPPAAYVDFVREVSKHGIQSNVYSGDIDSSAVENLPDGKAAHKTRKLRLLELAGPEVPSAVEDDLLAKFLFRRACKLDEEAGMLNHLGELLLPFVASSPAISLWMASTILPFTRRNLDYHTQDAAYSLATFQTLPSATAVQYLLSQTGAPHTSLDSIGRDLRGILSPWLYDTSRWVVGDEAATISQSPNSPSTSAVKCEGWEETLEWLVRQASKSWQVAQNAIEQWDGPRDVDFDDGAQLDLEEFQLHYLDQTYVKAILASTYSIQEGDRDALSGAFQMLCKARHLLGLEDTPPLQAALESLPQIALPSEANAKDSRKNGTSLRSNLLHTSNMLTDPTEEATDRLMGLIISASILTRMGLSCNLRRAGELALLQDEREQKSELGRLLRHASSQSQKSSDEYWSQTRRQILWLQSWGSGGQGSHGKRHGHGILCMVLEHDIEVELLKAMLSQSRFDLVKAVYEDSADAPLPPESVRDAVYHAALDAFDNASNPNRTKGGLRKCNDIVHALPKTVPSSLEITKQIESLLSAAHSLSKYRLVLKQGEPFSPVVLRVHSDPISIIDRVLEQNNGAFTRLQEFLEIGMNMVIAGFLNRGKNQKFSAPDNDLNTAMEEAERRIVASCISAALREDDFETAYSYVMSRFGGSEQASDDWSWKAALRAGEYVRTSKTQQPTHLGTSSANPEVRHLEQRLECLATALRVAPYTQLQTVLESFRDCEQQLDAAITDEAAKETAWDMTGDMRGVPGSFDAPQGNNYPPRNMTAAGTARQAEETPMSLFDLSRATARVASRNLTSLSSLNGLAQTETADQALDGPAADQQRVRKRDQFQKAATGTLVSGVGWLIGANVNRDRPNAT